jgi:hypothetical protein
MARYHTPEDDAEAGGGAAVDGGQPPGAAAPADTGSPGRHRRFDGKWQQWFAIIKIHEECQPLIANGGVEWRCRPGLDPGAGALAADDAPDGAPDGGEPYEFRDAALAPQKLAALAVGGGFSQTPLSILHSQFSVYM